MGEPVRARLRLVYFGEDKLTGEPEDAAHRLARREWRTAAVDRDSFRRYLEEVYRTAEGGTLTTPVASDYLSRAARAERLLGVDLDDADLAQVVERISSLPVTRGVAANLRTAVRVYAGFLARQRREWERPTVSAGEGPAATPRPAAWRRSV